MSRETDYLNILGAFFGDKYTLGAPVEGGYEIVDKDGGLVGWMKDNADGGCSMTWNPDRPKEVEG